MTVRILYAPDGGDSEYHSQEVLGVPQDTAEQILSDHSSSSNGTKSKTYTFERVDDRQAGVSIAFDRVAQILAFEEGK